MKVPLAAHSSGAYLVPALTAPVVMVLIIGTFVAVSHGGIASVG
jgi:hypothetical protein